MIHIMRLLKQMSLVLLATIACAQMAEARIVLDVASLATDTNPATAKKRAEDIARIAERFVRSYDLDYAARVAEIALDVDPQNMRAQLVQVYVQLYSPFRGFLYRMETIAGKMSKIDRDNYAESVKSISTQQTMRRFFLDRRQKPFETGGELRTLFRDAILRIDNMAAFLKSHENDVISVSDQQYSYKTQGEEYFSCDVMEISRNVFAIETCTTWQEKPDVKISKYDWQALRLDLIKGKWMMILTLAYSLDGLEKIVTDISNTPVKKLTVKSITKSVQSSPEFGKLIDRQSLSELVTLGGEATFVMREMMKTEACKSGVGRQRKGQYLGTARCLKFEFPFFGSRYNDAMNGPIEANILLAKKFAFNGPATDRDPVVPYKATIDMKRIVSGDVTSLQNVLPDQFDDCGRPTRLPDPTLNSVLPNGDLFMIVRGYDYISLHHVFLNNRCVKD